MGLVGLTVVKEYLGISSTDTTYDSLLGGLIDDVSTDVESALNRTLTIATYSMSFDIDEGQDTLFLPEFPIRAVVALTNDGSLVAAGDYHIYSDSGMIKLADRVELLGRDGTLKVFFYEGKKTVDVTWGAGYTTIPADIQGVVKRNVSAEFNMRDKQGYASERIGAYQYQVRDTSRETSGFTNRDLQVISRYRRRLMWE